MSKSEKTNTARQIYKVIKTGGRTEKLTREEAFIVRFTRWEWSLRKDGWFPYPFPPFKSTPENSPHVFGKKKTKQPLKKKQPNLIEFIK